MCADCKKTAMEANISKLRACARCVMAYYCNRERQIAHWKTHQNICFTRIIGVGRPLIAAHQSCDYASPRLRDIEKHVPNPFTKLHHGTYLHDRPEKDVYKLSIDSFRIRLADNLNLEGKATPNTIYKGASSSIGPFRQYLVKAATRPDLLPYWWSSEKKKECEAFGESDAWNDLRVPIDKEVLIDHYGDLRAPMQLRMLAEHIIGVGPMGHDGTEMRAVMMKMEQNVSEDREFVGIANFG